MIKQIFIGLAILGLLYVFYPVMRDFTPREKMHDLSEIYLESSAEDLHIQNAVTSVVVTYRGLDTLGEVTVLFLTTAGIAFLRKRKKSNTIHDSRKASELLDTCIHFLVPLIILFGAYIFIHGHLTPGGGFQGGVLIASAFVLLFFVDPEHEFNHKIMDFVESISGAFYVLIGALGIILQIGLLNPRFLPIGTMGLLFSGGAVGIIYSLVGLKVGTELTSIVDQLHGEENKME